MFRYTFILIIIFDVFIASVSMICLNIESVIQIQNDHSVPCACVVMMTAFVDNFSLTTWCTVVQNSRFEISLFVSHT